MEQTFVPGCNHTASAACAKETCNDAHTNVDYSLCLTFKKKPLMASQTRTRHWKLMTAASLSLRRLQRLLLCRLGPMFPPLHSPPMTYLEKLQHKHHTTFIGPKGPRSNAIWTCKIHILPVQHRVETTPTSTPGFPSLRNSTT